MQENLKAMHLSEHIGELKNRTIYVFSGIIILSLLSYFFIQEIYSFLLNPLREAYGQDLGNKKLIFTGLTELFFVYLKLSIYSGLVLSTPILLYNIYKFFAPALYKRERKILIPILCCSPILFIMGAMLAYYYVIPLAWKFFLGFEQNLSGDLSILLEAKVNEYLSLTITFIMAFGIAFQIPIVLVILVLTGIIDTKFLISKRRHAIVIMFILGAILTPPDIISQIALALPMIFLYESTIVFTKYFMPKGTKNA